MATAAKATGRGPCSEQRYEVTQQTAPHRRVVRMRKLIRCVFRHVGIPEEIPTAIRVMSRESGLRPWATNPVTSGVCRPYSSNPFGSCGLAQHLARYWAGRARTYLRARLFPSYPQVNVLQARANVYVTAKDGQAWRLGTVEPHEVIP